MRRQSFWSHRFTRTRIKSEKVQLPEMLFGYILGPMGASISGSIFGSILQSYFIRVFQEQGVTITYRQAREPMGLLKIEHIKAILKMPEVSERFRTAHGREWNQNDVAIMYQSFEKHLFASLQDFTTPVPGVIETMEQLRREGIRIGSTTGYTDAMMKIVQPGAAAQGYTVDCLVTPDHLPAGRPAPYMIYRNMTELAIPSVDEVVKVGDTIADIREGLNAKVCSVGVITGSNELGLTEEEYKADRGSVLNAHYTSPTVIRGIYDAVERMGFRSGNILEPSMGVGNFFGMLPDSPN